MNLLLLLLSGLEEISERDDNRSDIVKRFFQHGLFYDIFYCEFEDFVGVASRPSLDHVPNSVNYLFVGQLIENSIT